ncbi:MAG: hypothetical protein Q9182_005721 [Xanthomendoza sp. 2 TL-2023]
MDGDLVFRNADPCEDDELSRIMNHNWFQCLITPLDLITSTTAPLTSLQARRLAFYRAWFALVRAHSGTVSLAYTPSATHPAPSSSKSPLQPFTASPSNSIAAVVLLLPPHARPSWFEPLIAWRTGLLPGLFGLGLRGVWRVLVTFEGNVERMITEGLKARKVAGGDQANLVMCHGCVRNPQWEGKAPGRRLLNWAIEQWWERQSVAGESRTPVWLDTSIDEGVRAYQEIGFKVLGERAVDTGADYNGIKFKPRATEEAKEKARKRSRQWVMLKMPPEERHGIQAK